MERAAGRARACAARRVRERVLARDGPVDGAYVPVDSALCFSTIGMTASQDYVDELAAALETQRDPARAVLRRARARPAGDLDRATRPRCRRPTSSCWSARRSAPSRPRRGLVASLAPKPWPENAGNGCHIHFSLWEDTRNRFYDGSRDGPSVGQARSFIAGVLEHLPGLCGTDRAELQLVPPHRSRSTGPARSRCWGHDNREAPVRVPSVFRGAEEASTNAELKAADASCNPYLAFGGADRGRASTGSSAGSSRRSRSRSIRRRSPTTSAPRAGSVGCRRRRARRSTRSRPTTCCSARSARSWPAPTSPCAAPSGRPTPRETQAFEQQGHFEKY